MRVAISIPVHEAPAVIADQCRNILESTDDACVILHFSANAPDLVEQTAGELAPWVRDNRVIVNPTRLQTHGHNVLEAHVANFTHLEQLDHPFEHFCLDASNSLMIRRGLAAHVQKFDAGLRPVEYDRDANTWHLPHVRADEQMLALLRHLGVSETKVFGSQVEGTFYRRSLLRGPMQMIREHYRDYRLAPYPKEEILLSTVFCNMNPNVQSIVRPYVFCPWRRKSGLIKLLKTRLRRDYDVTTRDIDLLLAGKHPMRGDGGCEVFGVKRVARTMESPVRQYIAQIMRTISAPAVSR